MTRRALILGVIAYALLRLALAMVPGYPVDVQSYARWALRAARHGLAQVYRVSDMDYPPLYAYILYPFGKLYGWMAPQGSTHVQESVLLTVLMNLPPLAFDLGIAWLMLELVRRLGATGIPSRRVFLWSWALPALYLLNPVVLFNSGYWGQPDSVHSFFVLAAFFALAGDRLVGPPAPTAAGRRILPPGLRTDGSARAWIYLSLAALMKPLGAPYVPLLLALSLTWHGLRRTSVGLGAAAATIVIICLPFLSLDHPGELPERLFSDVGSMAFTSCNAHNLWWLLGAWREAEAPWLGPLTPTHVGLVLFGGLYLALLGLGYRVHRRQAGGITGGQGLALAAAVGLGFFMLSTHMHENHMFSFLTLFLPLLALSGIRLVGREQRRLVALFAAASLGVFLNLLLHDPKVSELWPLTAGGHSPIQVAHVARPFYVGQLWAIRVATGWNLATFVVFVFWLWRRPGLLDLPGLASRRAAAPDGGRA